MKEIKALKEELKAEPPKCRWIYKECGYARELFDCETEQEKLLLCINCQLAELKHGLGRFDEKMDTLLDAGRE